jgi:hypothetical protein
MGLLLLPILVVEEEVTQEAEEVPEVMVAQAL